MAAVAERIKQLEAELAALKVQESASSGSKPAARREQDRLFAGKEHTMTATGKIGGDFTATADPAFLAERVAVYDKVNEAYQARLAAKPKNPIKITMPDGGVKEGTSWETTPMDIAKSISNSLAKKCTVAEVAYTGERYATEVICKVEMDDDMDEMVGDQDIKGELYDLTRPLEGDCTLRLLTFDDELGKMVFWHSSAHVLGQGIERTFGGHLVFLAESGQGITGDGCRFGGNEDHDQVVG